MNLRINVLQIEVQIIGIRVPIMVKKRFSFFGLHFIEAHSVKKNLANIFPGMIVTLCGTDLSYV